MTKLAYDNIFESISDDPIEIAVMTAKSDQLIEMSRVLENYDLGEAQVREILRAVRDRTISNGVPANDNVPQPSLAPGYSHAAALNLFAADCHAASRKAGWYTDLATGKALDRNVPEMLMLIVSEISEAMEGFRKSKPGRPVMDDKLPHRRMIEVELADAAIRIGDLAIFLGLDLGGAVVEKMAFNATREDHKIEARRAAGGKAF